MVYIDSKRGVKMTKLSGFNVRSSRQTEWIDITASVQQTVADSGIAEGICVVFVPHTQGSCAGNGGMRKGRESAPGNWGDSPGAGMIQRS